MFLTSARPRKCVINHACWKMFINKGKVTDIFTIDVNKVVLYNKVSRNNKKDWNEYCRRSNRRSNNNTTACQDTKKYLAMAYYNKTRTPLMQCHLIFLRSRSECFNIGTSEMRLSSSYLKG